MASSSSSSRELEAGGYGGSTAARLEALHWYQSERNVSSKALLYLEESLEQDQSSLCSTLKLHSYGVFLKLCPEFCVCKAMEMDRGRKASTRSMVCPLRMNRVWRFFEALWCYF